MPKLQQGKGGKQQERKGSPVAVEVQPQVVEPGEGQPLGEPVPTQGKAEPPAAPEEGAPDFQPGQPLPRVQEPPGQG